MLPSWLQLHFNYTYRGFYHPMATSLSPIHVAAEKGELNHVKHILTSNPSLLNHTCSLKGWTPLMYPCHGRSTPHFNVMSYLLSRKGCDVDAEMKSGYTCFLLACHKGFVDAAVMLIKAGCNIKKERFDQGPLHLAAMNGNPALIGTLLGEEGVEINGWHGRSFTSLMYASESGHADAVRLLLRVGANAAIKCQDTSALLLASKNGHTEVMEILLKHLDFQATNIRDQIGRTALCLSVERGNATGVELLLSVGAYPHLCRQNDGEDKDVSPLYIAAREGC